MSSYGSHHFYQKSVMSANDYYAPTHRKLPELILTMMASFHLKKRMSMVSRMGYQILDCICRQVHLTAMPSLVN